MTKKTYSLFPEIEPNKTGLLRVDDIHQIYWEESGNLEGVPVVVLHGGPGGGSHPAMRRFFDPEYYRIILFDQRGAGKSLPYAEIKQNTTELLVQDIETLRRHLKVEKWHVFGGSWGSTLALAYSQSFPHPCLSLILRGVFLMRQEDIKWFLGGMKNIFPDVWQAFVDFLPEEERNAPLESYYQRLVSDEESISLPAAAAWGYYETAFSRLVQRPAELKEAMEVSNKFLGISRIEAHYFRNNLFSPDNQILQNCDKIKNIPLTIVQGRYDIVCPPIQAFLLHEKLPQSELVITEDAGHSGSEPATQNELLHAMKQRQL